MQSAAARRAAEKNTNKNDHDNNRNKVATREVV
jgi:hypothetical protein